MSKPMLFYYPDCYYFKDADACHLVNGSIYMNQTCFNSTYVTLHNISAPVNHTSRHAPAQDYFE